jgi:hypothetical protein
MKIKYNTDFDFHNSGDINLIISGQTVYGTGDDECYVISAGQYRRIKKHFCGITGCRCHAGAVQEYAPQRYCIAIKYCDEID